MCLPTEHQRSALVLLQEKDEISLGVALNGYEWALRKLDALTAIHGDNEATEMIAASLLKRLVAFKQWSECTDELPSFDKNARNQLARELGAHALKWKLPALWNDVIPHCEPSLESTVHSASVAVTTFDLEAVKPG